MISRGVRLASLALVAAVALSGCGDDDKDKGKKPASPSSSETTKAADDGMTDPGTELTLGESATITWRPKETLEGTIEVKVTRLDQTTIKDFRAFKLDAATKKSTPYYVHVEVGNVGDTDLSGVAIPLYLDNGSSVLIPAAKINSSFKPCPSRPLPKKFVKGDQAELCLVYLSPEGTTLQMIALRPRESEPAITWTGEITKPKKAKKKG